MFCKRGCGRILTLGQMNSTQVCNACADKQKKEESMQKAREEVEKGKGGEYVK